MWAPREKGEGPRNWFCMSVLWRWNQRCYDALGQFKYGSKYLRFVIKKICHWLPYVRYDLMNDVIKICNFFPYFPLGVRIKSISLWWLVLSNYFLHTNSIFSHLSNHLSWQHNYQLPCVSQNRTPKKAWVRVLLNPNWVKIQLFKLRYTTIKIFTFWPSLSQ